MGNILPKYWIWGVLIGIFDKIFFPKLCVMCGKYGGYLCFECANSIRYIKSSLCPSCGRLTIQSRFCRKCRRKGDIYLDSIIIGARYDIGPVKKLIYECKYQGISEITHLLAEIIIQGSSIYPPPDSIITYVPLSRQRQNMRGFNQSALIADSVASHFHLPVISLLKRTRNTLPQAQLNKSKRLENIKNAFTCHTDRSVADKIIYIIDDVTTTHMTLNECAKMLKLAGAKKVIGLVVAKNI